MKTGLYDDEEDDSLEVWVERKSQEASRDILAAMGDDLELSRKLEAAVLIGEPDFFTVLDGLLQRLMEGNPLKLRRTVASLIERATGHIAPGNPSFSGGCRHSKRWDELAVRLVKAAGDADEVVCRHSLFALARLVPRTGLDAITPMLGGPFRARDPQILRTAVEVVMAHGLDTATVAIPAISGLLDHADPGVRCMACDTLAEFTVDAISAVPKLCHTAEKDTHPNVRTRAVVALTEIAPEVAAVPLLSMIFSTGSSDQPGELLSRLLRIDATAQRTSEAVSDPVRQNALVKLLIALGPAGREFRRALPLAWTQESEVRWPGERKQEKSRVHKGMFKYHSKDEPRPDKFAHGPLLGSQINLVRWIMPYGKGDTRQLEHFADTTIWFQQINRILYEAYFCDPLKFQEADNYRRDYLGARPEDR